TVVLGRAGLACDGPPVRELRALARTRAYDALQQRRDERRRVRGQDVAADRQVVVDDPACFVADVRDRSRVVAEGRAVDPQPTVVEGGEGARHLERVDRLGAEADREVVLLRAGAAAV